MLLLCCFRLPFAFDDLVSRVNVGPPRTCDHTSLCFCATFFTGIPGEDYCHRIVAGPIESTHVPTATPTMCPESPEVTTSPTGPVSYRPGEKTTSSDDGYVALSTGLVAKAIAIAGSPVNLLGGGQSAENFHTRPDGAAVFPDECGGWAYVSNSEEGSSSVDTGGVGAIYFNAMGEVTGYKMIQKNTRRNCSGGKTWWGTWVTCEECGSTGGVFEVHPKGHPNGDATLKRKTLLGRRNGRSGGNYEGVAYYNPAPTDSNIRPAFYLTEDATSGPLERFRPSNAVLAESIATNDFYKLLHDDPDGTATTDYLNLITWETDDNHLSHYGTFDWSPDYTVGASNANSYFQKCEGIDVRNGMLYMTCKTNKQFFILDLEAGTYVESHTDGRTTDINGTDISISGPFTGQPDQIRAILNGTDDQLVYFCEGKYKVRCFEVFDALILSLCKSNGSIFFLWFLLYHPTHLLMCRCWRQGWYSCQGLYGSILHNRSRRRWIPQRRNHWLGVFSRQPTHVRRLPIKGNHL